MKAIILAAGYATRLYPLTLHQPKALLPLKGSFTILDFIIKEINTIEAVDEIYIVTNHKFAEHFQKWEKENNNSHVPIKVLDDGTTTEDNRLGAIGDIWFTVNEEKIDDEVMIIAGDNYFTYPLADYYRFYKGANKDCACVQKMDDPQALTQFAVAELDENGKIINLEEKPEHPKSDVAAFATYMYQKDTIPMIQTYLAEGNKPDAPGYFLQWLYTRKDVYAYIMKGICYDIGTLASYEEVKKLIQEQKL